MIKGRDIKRLLELFMLEVTDRSVANILEVSDYHLSLETDEIFEGNIGLDESYFGCHRKKKRERGTTGVINILTAAMMSLI